MKFSRQILLGGLLSISAMLSAQNSGYQIVTNPGGCGTVGHSPWLDWYRQHRHDLASVGLERGSDTSWLYAPVTVHIVGRDNGNGYFAVNDAIRVICQMNEQFAPAKIRYYFMPGEQIVYHNNTEWYEHDWGGGYDMIQNSNLDARLNCYVVDDPAGNCGYSTGEAIVMAKNCSGVNNSTWAHEAGHHFSLPHTFLGWEGTNYQQGQTAPFSLDWADVELLDGSNCHDSGDFFCDTKADYLSYRWGCNQDNESNVILTDPTGQQFRADGSFYMSYSSDECTSRFSAEQIEAMRSNLLDEHDDYLTTWELGPLLDDNAQVELVSPIDTQTAQYNNITLNWNPVPGADMYTVEVAISNTFPFLLTQKAIFDGTTSVKITGGVPNNRLIYWRVRAYSNWDLCQPATGQQLGVFKTVNLSATNDLERVATVDLMPNPVSGGGIAKLMVETSESMESHVRLTDASGKLVLNREVRLSFGTNEVEIETAALPVGVYNLALQTEKGTVVKRLSVMD